MIVPFSPPQAIKRQSSNAPSQTDLLMAAAEMHSLGRLVQDMPESANIDDRRQLDRTQIRQRSLDAADSQARDADKRGVRRANPKINEWLSK